MRPTTVLVAEDDPGVRMTLEFLLEDEGFEVVFAKDGEEALATARRVLPDVILLDNSMPKLEGRDVLTALRKRDETRAIPVLIISGTPTETIPDWSDAEFIGKPFVPEQLVDKIRAALNKS